MKMTKAQREIVSALAGGVPLFNLEQRQRVVQPLVDAGIVRRIRTEAHPDIAADGTWYFRSMPGYPCAYLELV